MPDAQEGKGALESDDGRQPMDDGKGERQCGVQSAECGKGERQCGVRESKGGGREGVRKAKATRVFLSSVVYRHL